MQPAASRVGLRPVKACLVAARPAISDWAQDTGSTSTKEPERLVASGLRRTRHSTLWATAESEAETTGSQWPRFQPSPTHSATALSW